MKKSSASSTAESGSADAFDPFNSRLSRDIRNSLSEAFVVALARMEPSAYRDDARIWRDKNLAQIYHVYIRDRLQRYDKVLAKIKTGQLEQPLLQSLVIWNQGLFFEFHEHLEGIWQQATGDERQALKGLIKAAGAYIHHEVDHQQAATRLAAKAYRLIRQHADCLAFIKNLDVLLDKLNRLDFEPLWLENPALENG